MNPASQDQRPGTLIYFGHVPAEGAGSAIIVYRHLKRFAEAGWKIKIVADWGQDHALCQEHGWETITLSHRKSWWPPFNPDSFISRKLRAWLWAGEVSEWLADEEPTAVLTYLSAFSDTLSIAAAGFAQRNQLPLATLVHDDARCFTLDKEAGNRAHLRRQWILSRSTTSHFASAELASIFQIHPSRQNILPPIPEGCHPRTSQEEAAIDNSAPLLVYAGNYWPSQLPALARIAGAARQSAGKCLCILKQNKEHIQYLQAAGADCMAPLPSNLAALEFIKSKASALVASYSDSSEEMPWIKTSFPSKLIEYCHLGIPIFIIAPEDSAVMAWARSRNFPLCVTPTDTVGLCALIEKLKNTELRRQMAELSLSFAKSEFDPVRIHAQLETSLLKNAV